MNNKKCFHKKTTKKNNHAGWFHCSKCGFSLHVGNEGIDSICVTFVDYQFYYTNNGLYVRDLKNNLVYTNENINIENSDELLDITKKIYNNLIFI